MIKYDIKIIKIYKNLLSIKLKSKVKLVKRVFAVASSFCDVYLGLHSFECISYDAWSFLRLVYVRV
jgi:hypothetical protein